MVATLAVPQKIVELLPIRLMKPATAVNTTVIDTIVRDASPVGIDITPSEFEYTDEQFHADLKKASSKLDAMIAKAIKDDEEGKTRKFPV